MEYYKREHDKTPHSWRVFLLCWIVSRIWKGEEKEPRVGGSIGLPVRGKYLDSDNFTEIRGDVIANTNAVYLRGKENFVVIRRIY